MTTKLVVLSDFYYPATAAGGPPKGIRTALARQPGMQIQVFCRDRDHLARAPFATPFVGTVEVDGVKITYLPVGFSVAALRGLVKLAAALCDADVIWVNSLHSRMFALPWLIMLRLVGAPVLVSPRGELSPSAIRSGHPRMKRCWHAVLRLLRLDRQVLWIASSQTESSDVSATFPRGSTFLLPETTSFGGHPLQHKELRHELRLLSLGRIAPIKGLDLGFNVLSHVKSQVRLDVVGPVEDSGYLEHLVALARDLAPNVRVFWHDPVDTAEVPRLIRECDALFSPTRGENFGHAIAESLALGRPAFIGPGTPWSFAQASGAVIILDPDRHQESAAKIDRFANADDGEVTRVQKAARLTGLAGLDGDGDLSTAVACAQYQRTPRHSHKRRPVDLAHRS